MYVSLLLWHVDEVVFLLVAAADHGGGGEPAGPGVEPLHHSLPVLQLLRRGGRHERLACPVPAPNGDALRQPAVRAFSAAAAAGDELRERARRALGRRRRRGDGPADAAGGRGLLLALLVEAAAERARVVRRGAHARATDLGGSGGGGGARRDSDGLDRRAGGGELETGERGGLVVGKGAQKDGAAGPGCSCRRHDERLEEGGQVEQLGLRRGRWLWYVS